MIDIDSDSALAGFCQRLSACEFVALDTEFIRERTYYPVLALVQVSARELEPTLIDPLKISDWAPFHDILMNGRIRKIFHAGRQDLEIFFNQMNKMPENLFDTQVAASMCGLGEQIGYSALVSKLLGVQLPKGSSYTDWLRRPLSETQLTYARDDVRFLPEIYQRLAEMAAEKNRLSWIIEEIEQQFPARLFDQDPEELWRRVKRSSGLTSRNASVLRGFAIWRDELAREVNKPVRFIVNDDILLEMAKIENLTMDHLNAHRGLPAKFVARYGPVMIKVHRQARSQPRHTWPNVKPRGERRMSVRREALADLAWLLLKEIAGKADMAASHLAQKKDIKEFIEAYCIGEDVAGFSVNKGWRKEMVGRPLIALIEGEVALRVKNRRIVWEEA